MKNYVNPPKSMWNELTQRPKLESKKLEDLCTAVFTDVLSSGDAALRSYTRKFDGVDIDSVVVPAVDIARWAKRTKPVVRKAIEAAYQNIRTFHRLQVLRLGGESVEVIPGVTCWRETRPIETVGLYIPGGSAPLISTVLMLGVPAQIAGSKQIVMCTPPQSDGSVNPAICYAVLKIGVTKLIRVGGMQAIAAMAVGTSSVPKVDKLFGPGNQYVTAAKQYALNYNVAIDMPAGPSEVMVIADTSAIPAFVAADLLSQAEHGSDSQVVLIASSKQIALEVKKELSKQLALLPRKDIAEQSLQQSRSIVFTQRSQALAFANMYAPEHLILSVDDAEKLAIKVQNAGSVFLGNYSPESAGDYASGTNHTLPTGGWAKSYSGLSVDSFVKKILFQTITPDGLRQLAPTIERLAEAEGLEAHKQAVTIRFEDFKI